MHSSNHGKAEPSPMPHMYQIALFPMLDFSLFSQHPKHTPNFFAAWSHMAGTNRVIFLTNILNAFFFSLFLFLYSPQAINAQEMSISFDKQSLVMKGDSSDQWHMTWHGDGTIYSVWGDGTGWDKNRNCYLGVTRISGTPPNFSGTDLFCQPRPSSTDIKPNALYSIGNTLYLFYHKKTSLVGGAEVFGSKSTDNGATFTTGKLVVGAGSQFPGVRLSGMVHFKQGHSGLPASLDGAYVYALFADTNSMDTPLYLARGRTSDPLNPSNWEWYNGKSWGSFEQRKIIHNTIKGLDWFHTIMIYNAPLNKYFLNYYTGTTGTLHVLVADQPWGPFKEIYTGNMGVDNFLKFTVQVMPNTISDYGKTMWYAFSGWPEWDKVGFIKATLTGNITVNPGITGRVTPRVTGVQNGCNSLLDSTEGRTRKTTSG